MWAAAAAWFMVHFGTVWHTTTHSILGLGMSDQKPAGDLLSVREIGEVYGIPRSTLYRYVRSGKVHAYRRGRGRETYVPRDDLEALGKILPRESAMKGILVRDDTDDALVATEDGPIYAIPIDGPNGEAMTLYTSDEHPFDEATERADIERALALIGAWSDLDWDEAEEELYHIRHDSVPTPPIEDL